MALRQWKPQRLNQTRVHASTHDYGAIALTIAARSGRRCLGHGVVAWRRTPARLCAVLKLYRAPAATRVDAVSCWGGGGVVVVMEKRLGQPVTGNGDGGERQERAVAGVIMASSGASWPAWLGQRRRAAIAASTRRPCPGDGRPLNQPV